MVFTVPVKWLLIGLLTTSLGILSIIWTPYDILLEDRLRMRPGLPPYDWWYDPPDVIRLKFYLFNITNADRYLSGEDEKLKLEEVGPIVFREVVSHSDPVFNENSTLSFTVYRHAIWDPSLNTIDLNTTLIYPNLPVLLTASIFWDTNYFVKLVLNSVFEATRSQTIVKKTIYEILYNNTDPFLNVAHSTFPSIAVHENVGLIPMIYPGYGNRMNVFIGPKFGHKRFFLIDKFNGTVHIPGRGSSCKDNLTDTTNAIIYSQLVSRTDRIEAFNHLMCRSATLVYKEDVTSQGFTGYKFVGDRDAYNRTQPPEDDCYSSTPALLDGLTDFAPCWFNYPIVGSFPHFLYADEKVKNSVEGLKPDASKHRTYATFEPTSGSVLQSSASMQINIYMKPIQSFHRIFEKFSNMIIPIFWMDTSHDHIPNYVVILLRIMLLLPWIGAAITSLLLLIGIYSTWRVYKHFSPRLKPKNQEDISGESEPLDISEKIFIRHSVCSQKNLE